MKHSIVLFIVVFITTLSFFHPSGSLGRRTTATIPSQQKSLPQNDKTVMPADYGNPYINHYQFGQSDMQITSICQDAKGEMIFANKQGIIVFNGRSWERLKLPSVPTVLRFLADQNIILIGLENQYGYLQRNAFGVYEYYQLSGKESIKSVISEIKITSSYIYFYSQESLFRHHVESLKLDKSWPVEAGNIYNGIIQIGDDIYINVQNKGLYKISSDGKKTLVNKNPLISQKQIVFSIPVSKKKVIIGTMGNNFYTFDGSVVGDFSTPAGKYISESFVTNGIDLSEDIFAVSTISGGCIILNKKGGKIINIVDIKAGLPDNEIYAVGKDVNGGLWLSHGYGVSNVNYNLPVKDFNKYPGIEGSIIDVVVFKKITYVATNQGVFYQDSITKLKEVVKPGEKKSVFRKLKDRIIGSEKSEKTETASKIYSINYVFEKVKNIDGKCRQIIKYKDVLLVATNKGLFEIKDKKSKIILKKDYVNFIFPSKSAGLFYIGTDKGITAIKSENNNWKEYPEVQPKDFNEPVYTISEDSKHNIWAGNDSKVFYIGLDKNLVAMSSKVYDFGGEIPDKYSIKLLGDSVFFLSNSQEYFYNPKSDKIDIKEELTKSRPFVNYIANQSEITWLQKEKEWICISDNFKPTINQLAILNLFDNIQNIYADEYKTLWIIDSKNGLYRILPDTELENQKEDFKVFVQKIKDNKGNLVSLDDLEIASGINLLTFTISAPDYIKPAGTEYQYIIKGMMNDWSEWSTNPDFVFYSQPGKYVVQVRAKNILGEISSSDEYSIFVKSPIWKKPWFVFSIILIAVLTIGFSIIFIQKKRAQKLQRDNKILETKVEERTMEIVKQKEQIERKNKEITNSLKYASNIQTAVLPSTEILKKYLDDYFIFNRPREFVSGDFYWVNEIDGKLLVTAADCTGHGVPGAFLSLLGVTFLNEITSKMETLSASNILEALRERLIKSLNQEKENTDRLDGIDLTMVIIDFEKMKLQFAGAYNSMYLVRNTEFFEFKGDKMPVGMHAFRNRPFTNHDVDIKKDDVIYLFSDGFMDQFGGDSGRKFFGKNFRALLSSISHHPLPSQAELLGEILEAWRGNHHQVDDILIVGLKI